MLIQQKAFDGLLKPQRWTPASLVERQGNLFSCRTFSPIGARRWFKVDVRSREGGELIWTYPFAKAEDAIRAYLGMLGISTSIPARFPGTWIHGDLVYELAAVQSFTSTGTTSWTAPWGVQRVEYLVVAGGGAGARRAGGGAGGMRVGLAFVVAGTAYTVTVGLGGTGQTDTVTSAGDGGASVFDVVSTVGGGAGGGTTDQNGRVGGSGGGGQTSGTGAAGTTNEGNVGGNGEASSFSGGGGGGKKTAGAAASGAGAGIGGDGEYCAISGSGVPYAGGGGGASFSGSAAAGGLGGGGAGINGGTGTAGTANTGGGGGGSSNGTGGAGATGIVILCWAPNILASLRRVVH